MRIFFNYAHVDLSTVEGIAAFLTDEKHEIVSQAQLLPTQDWAAKLTEQIAASDVMIYALTPDSLAAEWCQWNLAQAIQQGKPVIPALIRESSSVPDALASLSFVDFAGGLSVQDKEALRQALNNLPAYVVNSAQAVPAPAAPGGIPAQAMGSVDISRANSPRRTLLPDILALLPPPFEWLDIPAGEVTLKDASQDGGSQGGTFRLSRFAIGRYAVTNAQYRVFMEDTKGYSADRWWDFSEAAKTWRADNPTPPSVSPDESKPVVGISWFEAVAFCRWLNVRVRPGLAMANRDMPSRRQPIETIPTIALPTEQQWQHAIENDKERMDLSGNVLEWCMTGWGSDNVVLGGNVERVVRVGSLEEDEITRLSHRDLAKPNERNHEFGFRLVCYLPTA
ncbi:MAG: SUMF1/EgtB/PvdO family nonheme iron enzyme [Chloroflexi bacterium]|nr:SUMF1/EgtB/PvdO family nonheme iron enzyme [Chloroflexota bacterium]MCC6895593.1 SUMF1/EgtB/PvdO family nonheme iron enzyme [Anaerolineae bacterium]